MAEIEDLAPVPLGRLRCRSMMRAGLLPWLRLDADERISDAGCTCSFFQQNRLRKGPCEHVLALRLHHARQRRSATTLTGDGERGRNSFLTRLVSDPAPGRLAPRKCLAIAPRPW